MIMIRFVWTCVVLSSCMSIRVHAVSGSSETETIELRQMQISRSNITLSGFSAGGSMAQHVHLSHSSLFSGIAIFSQAFYLCGHTSLVRFGLGCGTYGLGLFKYSVNNSINDARRFANSNLIDSLEHLNAQRVFLWIGAKDIYIPVDSVEKGVEFYTGVGVHQDNIKYIMFTNASHCIPTENYGAACDGDAINTFYLGNCQWSGPYHALSYILRTNTLTEATADLDQLKMYNQSEFYSGSNISEAAMGTRGFIYIPKKCETEECMLHLNFHGCNEWEPSVAEEYIKNSGFLPIAEGNGIIMIFPLTTKTPQNMGGCWDFFSYLPNIGTKNSPQVMVIERLLRRVLDGE